MLCCIENKIIELKMMVDIKTLHPDEVLLTESFQDGEAECVSLGREEDQQ